jgi:large subunit ribosomal protein L30
MPDKLRITLRRSPIGNKQNQKDTARSLGFTKLQQTVEHEDSPVVRGMIHKIRHLVEVETVTGE